MEPPALAAGPAAPVRAAPGAPAALLLPPPLAGTKPFTYRWSRAGASLDDRFTSSEDAGGVRLSVSAAQTGDSGVYTLQASNAAGSDTSKIRLEVSAEEAPIGDDPPAFLRRLQDLTVKVGSRTRFLVEIISSTECKVTWYRNERRLLEAERVALARDGNFWCADVAAVSVDDAGRWTCTAENAGGRASCSAHLNVLVPKAYKRPEFMEELRALLTEQGTVSLECKVIGVPTPVLRWFKDSREIKAGDVFALTANAEDPTSLGTYTCEAVNCMGRAYSSSKVHVVGRASREGSARPSSSGMTPEPPPIFTKELEDAHVKICEHLTLGCHIVVPPWPRSVVWYNKEGKVEPGERYHTQEDGVGGYLLEIPSTEWADEGEWKCVATSAGGRVGISTCYVAMDVPKNYRKPRFMENLQAVLTEEGLVSFECKVVGFPTPVLSWFKDGQELKPGDVYQLTGTNSLGSYCCIARNCMGKASSSAELTVEDIQNQLNEEEKLQLFSKNQAPKFIQGLKSVEAKIDEPFRFIVKVAIPPEPSVLWYRDDQPVDESNRCHLEKEDKGVFNLDIRNLEFLDQAEWKCVAMNDFGHSVTSCFLKLIIPRHYKKPRFLENLQAILSDEGAVNLECKVIGVPQPILKWYKDGEELKPGDIHRIISGQDGTCCLGTYTCEAQNCMGIAASSASLLGFDDSMKAKAKKTEEQTLQRNLSLSTIHEERTSQMYDTPVGDITLDDKGEISFSFDGKEVSVSLYETPDLTEEEALQIVEMYADQLSENVTEHNVVELPPLRFVKETSTSGNLLMEAIIIDVSPEYFPAPDERTEADVEDLSIADENGLPQLSLDQEIEDGGEDYLQKTMALLSDEKSDFAAKSSRKKTDSQRSIDDFYSLSRDQSEEIRDDDTHVSESELQSFASARSSAKIKSKSSKPSDEPSDPTKTILMKEEAELKLKKELTKQQESEVHTVKPKRERRTSRGSRRSSTSSDKSIGKSREELLRVKTDPEQLPKQLTMDIEEFRNTMNVTSTSLTKIINDIQLIERDIILKSELMASAATASRSLEIISSLITPLSEINSIADAAKESVTESREIASTIFNSIPQPLKVLQQSLTIIEKCIDMESDSKTLVKKTCVAFIETCGTELQKVLSDITSVTSKDYLMAETKIINEIDSVANEITTLIKLSTETIKTRNLLTEASEIKQEEPTLEVKHLRDTQKAVFELKTPLNSLLRIVENAENEKITDFVQTKNSAVIMHDMSASIQDLQTALEQIESLSVKESSTNLQKHNTEIIETVMESVLKLRNSFELLSTEPNIQEEKAILNQTLKALKENLTEISHKINAVDEKVGQFDVLQSENKLEILQKMAQILIALENYLPRLEYMPEIKSNLDTFHKNLTKVLENVIESNDAKKYVAMMEICDTVNIINSSIKNLDSVNILPLASLSNSLKIIRNNFIENIFESELNCSLLNNISDILVGIQEAINKAEEVSIQIESDTIKEMSTPIIDMANVNVLLEQIDQTIAAVNMIKIVESTQELKMALAPTLESICPILEELRRCVACVRTSGVELDENITEISDTSLAQTLASPLCELNQNIIILNQVIVENIEEIKDKTEIITAVAEPLHELQTTLEIIQHDVISQYGDDLTPYEVSINMASVVQNLQSCIIMIHEQAGVEGADDMSTLEDISGIKTTADTLPSDHLVLPTAEETTIDQSLPPYLVQEIATTATAQTLQALNEHITVLQSPEVIEALDTLSEVSDYFSLKSVVVGLGDLQSGLQGILHPMPLEGSIDLEDLANISKLAAIAEPMQDIQQSLSVLDTNNIPIYENILDLPTEKVHSVFQSISDFKNSLEQCMNAVLPAIEITSNTIEVSNKVSTLREVCEQLKNIFETSKDAPCGISGLPSEIHALENVVDSLIDATDVSKEIKIDLVKSITEELYSEVMKAQEEIIQFTAQTPEKLSQEAKLIQIVSEVKNNIAALEQYDFIDLSQASEITTACISPQIAFELDTEALTQVYDIAENAVDVLHDSYQEIPLADLMILEDFFKTCKNQFTILHCLLSKATSHKTIIRLLQEFSSLQVIINNFTTKRVDLHLSDEVNECLTTYLIHADECLRNARSTLLKVINTQSDMLIKTPISQMESIHELKHLIKSEPNTSIGNVVKILIECADVSKSLTDYLLRSIINEVSQSAEELEPKQNEIVVAEKLEELNAIVNAQYTSCMEDLEASSQIVLSNLIDCINKHLVYKDAIGTGKTLIAIKCLAECVKIVNHEFTETKLSIDEPAEVKENILKEVLTEMIQPLQALQAQLVNIQEQVLAGTEEDSISIDITTTESIMQTLTELHKDIVQQVESNKATIDKQEINLIKEVDKEIHTIQDSIMSMDNVQASQAVKEITKPIEDIEKSLQDVLSTDKDIVEKTLTKESTSQILDTIDQYIELIEIVEEISAVIKIEDVKESFDIASKLKQIIYTSESISASVEVQEEQTRLALKLQGALSALHVQLVESAKELAPVLSADALQRIAQVTAQLQANLVAVTGTHLAVQALVPFIEVTTPVESAISEVLSSVSEPVEVKKVKETFHTVQESTTKEPVEMEVERDFTVIATKEATKNESSSKESKTISSNILETPQESDEKIEKIFMSSQENLMQHISEYVSEDITEVIKELSSILNSEELQQSVMIAKELREYVTAIEVCHTQAGTDSDIENMLEHQTDLIQSLQSSLSCLSEIKLEHWHELAPFIDKEKMDRVVFVAENLKTDLETIQVSQPGVLQAAIQEEQKVGTEFKTAHVVNDTAEPSIAQSIALVEPFSKSTAVVQPIESEKEGIVVEEIPVNIEIKQDLVESTSICINEEVVAFEQSKTLETDAQFSQYAASAKAVDINQQEFVEQTKDDLTTQDSDALQVIAVKNFGAASAEIEEVKVSMESTIPIPKTSPEEKVIPAATVAEKVSASEAHTGTLVISDKNTSTEIATESLLSETVIMEKDLTEIAQPVEKATESLSMPTVETLIQNINAFLSDDVLHNLHERPMNDNDLNQAQRYAEDLKEHIVLLKFNKGEELNNEACIEVVPEFTILAQQLKQALSHVQIQLERNVSRVSNQAYEAQVKTILELDENLALVVEVQHDIEKKPIADISISVLPTSTDHLAANLKTATQQNILQEITENILTEAAKPFEDFFDAPTSADLLPSTEIVATEYTQPEVLEITQTFKNKDQCKESAISNVNKCHASAVTSEVNLAETTAFVVEDVVHEKITDNPQFSDVNNHNHNIYATGTQHKIERKENFGTSYDTESVALQESDVVEKTMGLLSQASKITETTEAVSIKIAEPLQECLDSTTGVFLQEDLGLTNNTKNEDKHIELDLTEASEIGDLEGTVIEKVTFSPLVESDMNTNKTSIETSMQQQQNILKNSPEHNNAVLVTLQENEMVCKESEMPRQENTKTAELSKLGDLLLTNDSVAMDLIQQETLEIIPNLDTRKNIEIIATSSVSDCLSTPFTGGIVLTKPSDSGEIQFAAIVEESGTPEIEYTISDEVREKNAIDISTLQNIQVIDKLSEAICYENIAVEAKTRCSEDTNPFEEYFDSPTSPEVLPSKESVALEYAEQDILQTPQGIENTKETANANVNDSLSPVITNKIGLSKPAENKETICRLEAATAISEVAQPVLDIASVKEVSVIESIVLQNNTYTRPINSDTSYNSEMSNNKTQLTELVASEIIQKTLIEQANESKSEEVKAKSADESLYDGLGLVIKEDNLKGLNIGDDTKGPAQEYFAVLSENTAEVHQEQTFANQENIVKAVSEKGCDDEIEPFEEISDYPIIVDQLPLGESVAIKAADTIVNDEVFTIDQEYELLSIVVLEESTLEPSEFVVTKVLEPVILEQPITMVENDCKASESASASVDNEHASTSTQKSHVKDIAIPKDLETIDHEIKKADSPSVLEKKALEMSLEQNKDISIEEIEEEHRKLTIADDLLQGRELIANKEKITSQRTKEPLNIIERSHLIQQIDAFISVEVNEIVDKIANITNIETLKESVGMAKKLRESVLVLDYSTNEETSPLDEKDKLEQARLAQKLQDALSTLHTQALDSAQVIAPIISSNALQKISEIITHLQDDLATVIVSEVKSISGFIDFEVVDETEEQNSMAQLETLLKDVNMKINLTPTVKITDTDYSESLKDTLDEVQTVIIKLKREYDDASNETFNETLEDLECSVRSVQLQINEESPPELLSQACATLQLLVDNMNATQQVQASSKTTQTQKTENIIMKCSNETDETVKLLDIASKFETNESSNLTNIVINLNIVRSSLKSLRDNFFIDADTVIENGVEIVQCLDQIEDRIFLLEKDIDTSTNVAVSIKDSILTAVHSVYGSISNMRSTVSFVQKRYMFENYGKPSESLLHSIKNITVISAVKDDENKLNLKKISKSLRKVLNHFEDIKFYINLDKTARLPSDAAFTKIILKELEDNIFSILVPQAVQINPDMLQKVNNLLKCVEKNLKSIELDSSIEVKNKIPMFKEIAAGMLKTTTCMKKYLKESEEDYTSKNKSQDSEETVQDSKTPHELAKSEEKIEIMPITELDRPSTSKQSQRVELNEPPEILYTDSFHSNIIEQTEDESAETKSQEIKNKGNVEKAIMETDTNEKKIRPAEITEKTEYDPTQNQEQMSENRNEQNNQKDQPDTNEKREEVSDANGIAQNLTAVATESEELDYAEEFNQQKGKEEGDLEGLCLVEEKQINENLQKVDNELRKEEAEKFAYNVEEAPHTEQQEQVEETENKPEQEEKVHLQKENEIADLKHKEEAEFNFQKDEGVSEYLQKEDEVRLKSEIRSAELIKEREELHLQEELKPVDLKQKEEAEFSQTKRNETTDFSELKQDKKLSLQNEQNEGKLIKKQQELSQKETDELFKVKTPTQAKQEERQDTKEDSEFKQQERDLGLINDKEATELQQKQADDFDLQNDLIKKLRSTELIKKEEDLNLQEKLEAVELIQKEEAEFSQTKGNETTGLSKLKQVEEISLQEEQKEGKLIEKQQEKLLQKETDELGNVKTPTQIKQEEKQDKKEDSEFKQQQERDLDLLNDKKAAKLKTKQSDECNLQKELDVAALKQEEEEIQLQNEKESTEYKQRQEEEDRFQEQKEEAKLKQPHDEKISIQNEKQMVHLKQKEEEEQCSEIEKETTELKQMEIEKLLLEKETEEVDLKQKKDDGRQLQQEKATEYKQKQEEEESLLKQQKDAEVKQKQNEKIQMQKKLDKTIKIEEETSMRKEIEMAELNKIEGDERLLLEKKGAATKKLKHDEEIRMQQEKEATEFQRMEEEELCLQKEKEAVEYKRKEEEELRLQNETQATDLKQKVDIELCIQKDKEAEELEQKQENDRRFQNEKEIEFKQKQEEELKLKQDEEVKLKEEEELRLKKEKDEIKQNEEKDQRFQNEKEVSELKQEREEVQRLEKEKEVADLKEKEIEELRLQKEKEMAKSKQKQEALILQQEKKAVESKQKEDEELGLKKQKETADLKQKKGENQRLQTEKAESELNEEENLRIQKENEIPNLEQKEKEELRSQKGKDLAAFVSKQEELDSQQQTEAPDSQQNDKFCLKKEKEASDLKQKEDENRRLQNEKEASESKQKQEEARKIEKEIEVADLKQREEEDLGMEKENTACVLKNKEDEDRRLEKEKEPSESKQREEKDQQMQKEKEDANLNQQGEKELSLQKEKDLAELKQRQEEKHILLHEKEAAELKQKNEDKLRLKNEKEASDLKQKEEEAQQIEKEMADLKQRKEEDLRLEKEKAVSELKKIEDEGRRWQKEKEASELKQKEEEAQQIEKEIEVADLKQMEEEDLGMEKKNTASPLKNKEDEDRRLQKEKEKEASESKQKEEKDQQMQQDKEVANLNQQGEKELSLQKEKDLAELKHRQEEKHILLHEKEAAELKQKNEDELRLKNEKEASDLKQKEDEDRRWQKEKEASELKQKEEEAQQIEKEMADLKQKKEEDLRLEKEKAASELKKIEEEKRILQHEKEAAELKQKNENKLRLEKEKEASDLKQKEDEDRQWQKEKEASELKQKEEEAQQIEKEMADLKQRKEEDLRLEKEKAASELIKIEDEDRRLQNEKEESESKQKEEKDQQMQQEKEVANFNQQGEKELSLQKEKDLAELIQRQEEKHILLHEKEAAELKQKNEDKLRLKNEKEASDLKQKEEEAQQIEKEMADLKQRKEEDLRLEKEKAASELKQKENEELCLQKEIEAAALKQKEEDKSHQEKEKDSAEINDKQRQKQVKQAAELKQKLEKELLLQKKRKANELKQKRKEELQLQKEKADAELKLKEQDDICLKIEIEAARLKQKQDEEHGLLQEKQAVELEQIKEAEVRVQSEKDEGELKEKEKRESRLQKDKDITELKQKSEEELCLQDKQEAQFIQKQKEELRLKKEKDDLELKQKEIIEAYVRQENEIIGRDKENEPQLLQEVQLRSNNEKKELLSKVKADIAKKVIRDVERKQQENIEFKLKEEAEPGPIEEKTTTSKESTYQQKNYDDRKSKTDIKPAAEGVAPEDSEILTSGVKTYTKVHKIDEMPKKSNKYAERLDENERRDDELHVFKNDSQENGNVSHKSRRDVSQEQHYIKEYQYKASQTSRTVESREKPRFVDHNHRDYTMEFARPSGYRDRHFDTDKTESFSSHEHLGRNATIYKAQTLVLDAQVRSLAPPYPEISISRTPEPTERRSEFRHERRSKARSEARSVVSEKRTALTRDSKRKPVFSTYLTDRTAVEGSRVKLTCSVLSSSDPAVTWYKNGVIIENKLKYRTKIIDGLVTLEVLNAIPSDSAEYSCTISNENGSVNSSANLKVYPSFEASPIPPTFTRSIRDTYHIAENELVLECRIRGQPLPTITWLKDDQPTSGNSRYQAYYLADGVCRLAIEHPTPEDSGKYTCKAENSVWSDEISHVVHFTGKENRVSPNIATIEKSRFNRQAMESRRPHFTNVLSDYKVVQGGTIGLQVEIRGAPTRVEWLREGCSVTEVYRNAKTFEEQGLYTLALSDVTEKESGMYTCRAWSLQSHVDMNAAITVVQPNELDGRPAIIVGRPEKDILISVGEDINISFRVQGEPKPKVIFMKGIRDITTSQRVCKMNSDDYVKFTLKRSVIADAGTYCILARNAYGCDRAFVTVVIRQRASSDNLISDWTYPTDDTGLNVADRKYKSVPERIPGVPTVVEGGNNWLSLAWPKSEPGSSAPVLAYKVESWLIGTEGGARWTELGITPLTSFDAFNLKQGEEYHFRVTPRNRYGWGESVQTPSPISVGSAGDRPEFTESLLGQLKVLVGTTANLSCCVKGKPVPEVVWMKNGHEIEDEDRRLSSSFNGFNCCLTIKDINIEDEARYSCEAANVHGRASTYARLAVVTDRSIWEADAKLKRERSADVAGDFPPQFTMRLRDRRVQATYPVRLTCQVIGGPHPAVSWFRDGQPVKLDLRRNHFQDEHFHTLEIAPTNLEDGGVYEVMARNSSGAVSCHCSLVVDKGIRAYVAPEFCCGLEPLYKLKDGEELRITAVVEAYPSVGVTWYRDGVRLRPSRRTIMTLDRDGQIELALAAVTSRDAGVYTCTASNEVGRASTSGKVDVTGTNVVRTPPVFIAPDEPYSKEPMFIRKPRSSEAREGDTVIIACEVVGDPKPDVYWLRDFLKPDYYRDATHFKRVGDGPEYRFEIPHAKLDYTGAYSVVAKNQYGEAKAIISLQILAKDPSSTDDAHNISYGRVEVLPRFSKDLTDLLSCDGDVVEFECRLSGNPEPTIKWFHYHELIRDSEDFETTFDDGAARLKIKQVTAEDEGTYTCEAANNLGKATSSACLVVYPPGEPNTLSQRLRRPPAFLSAASTPRSTPRSTPARSVSRTPGPEPRRLCSPARTLGPAFYTYPFNKVAEEGETVTLQCAIKGNPAPWATWDKDGVILTPSARVSIKEKEELRMIEIEEISADDVGVYRITIENEFGRQEATARIEVITQRGKFYAGVRAVSPSPRKSMTYRSRRPSTPRQD